MTTRATDLAAATIATLLATSLPAAVLAETIIVRQKDRRFETRYIEITAGDIVSFTNEDRFLHQLYTESPNFAFDSAEQFPDEIVEVRFPHEGTYEVRCGIHPKMLLEVEVDPKGVGK